MNFLAHAHLSGENEALLFGNFVADSIKGRQLQSYSRGIVQGVQLHRTIDAFTDQHPLVRSSVARVKPDLGRYAGVAVDIFYDHFLALHWNRYSATDLTDFSLWVYHVMGKFFSVLPPRSRRILPYMIGKNWLVSYSNLYDLERVFRGMDRRTGYKSQMGRAVEVLKTYYIDLQEEFTLFYPDLQSMVSQELLRLHREATE